MTKVEDLLWSPWSNPSEARPEMDPLAREDALLEAQLLDVRVHALSSTVGLLFELRTSFLLRGGNAAVLVAHGVQALNWSAEPWSRRLTAWTVLGSEPKSDDQLFSLHLDFWRSQLDLVAAAADFYVIDVPGLGETPPDYVDDGDTEIRARLVGWDSPLFPVQAVHLP
jgi:hypothetical protein